MKTVQLSCSHALIKYLIAQKTIINGKKEPLFQEHLVLWTWKCCLYWSSNGRVSK